VDDVHMGRIDNGQHLLIGAYTETVRLIERLHPDNRIDHRLLRVPLHLESADGAFKLHAPQSLPSPLNTLWALISARGLSFGDRIAALRLMTSCRLTHWQAQPLETVSALLRRHRQSPRLLNRLWRPLCLAALNTPVEQACAQLFLNVLRDSLDNTRQASDLLIPRVDLTELWPLAASRQVDMRYRHIVRSVVSKQHHVDIDAEAFDACVIATPPYAAERILFNGTQSTHAHSLHTLLKAFDYRAIATLTLELEAPWRLPQPMMMLDENIAAGEVGQWVFNRLDQHRQVTIVISDAADYLKLERASFVQILAGQVRQQSLKHPNCSGPMPDVSNHRLIVEKRATFSAIPGLSRPTNQSPWSRIMLAGDWTDTGYPSVLEGAVRSGQQAADMLMNSLASSN
jgi:hydroxysqualene dehydroxylase